MNDRALAYHEAGHACIAAIKGAPITRVTMQAAEVDVTAVDLRDALLICCAGAAAEARATKRPAQLDGRDRADAETWVRALGSGWHVKHFEVLAADLVETHWRFVEHVADQLLRRRALSGADVQALITRKDPDMSVLSRLSTTDVLADSITEAIGVATAPLHKRIGDLERDRGRLERQCALFERQCTALRGELAELRATAVVDGGIWDESRRYPKNSLVTHRGTVWTALKDVPPNWRPGIPGDFWALRVKHDHAR